MSTAAYTVRRHARALFVPIRGLRYHVMTWGEPALATPETPPLVLLHGWMPIGCPMVMFAPETLANFARTSSMNSARVRSLSTNGASISAAFTPWACSSSSALPVRRVVVWISGILSSSASTRLPILLLSAKEMPGKLTEEMTSEPSLNSGKKLRPKPESR